jgi:hypothetical protein
VKLLNFPSVFKTPESAVTVGLAEAGIVYAVYSHALPPMTDIRAAQPLDVDVSAARRRAAIMSASIIGLVFVMTRDINSTLIGAAALAGIDLTVKHCNGVHPSTGRLVELGGSAVADNDTAWALPEYADATSGDSDY